MLVAAWIPSAAAQSITFTEVSAAAGLSVPTARGCGVAVGDVDGDGWLDLCLTGNNSAGTRIFRNDGDGTFVDISDTVLPADTPMATAAALVDIDGDHDADLVLGRRFGSRTLVGLDVLHNEGGVFVRLGPPGGLGPASGALGGLVVGDLDADGDADVVIVRTGGGGTYYRNDGGGFFSVQTAAFGAGLDMMRNSWAAVLADFDNDRDLDLHVAVDRARDFHAHNNGDGTFVDVSGQVGTTSIGFDMGLAVGDIDDDGDLDIYSTNIGYGVLYVNDGAGNFTQEADARGVGTWTWAPTAVGWGTVFADLDLDGDEDLSFVTVNAPGGCYQNQGTGTFAAILQSSGLNLDGSGLVAFDYDRDGDLDLLVTRCDNVRLYQNVTPRNGLHWLIVRPYSSQSAPGGVGVRITVQAGPMRMMREIFCGGSFLCAGPLEAHFGMGPCPMADEVFVRWPNGAARRLTHVAVDQVLTVSEPWVEGGSLLGDVDADNDVDLDDLTLLLSRFGGPVTPDDPADLDGDGSVLLNDLSRLLMQFGSVLEG